MVTAAFFGMIYVLFTFTVAAGRPPFVRSVNIYTTEFSHKIQCRFFVGIERMGAKCTGNIFSSLLSQQKSTDEIETEIDLHGKCIRNHGNTNENTISVNVRINKTQRIRVILAERTPNPVDTNRSNIWANKNAEHSCRFILCCMRFAVASTPTETNKT